MDSKLPVRILSYDDLRGIADNFLDSHHADRTVPIPIEQIIDARLGISIVLEMALQDICGVDAFVNPAGDAIHVDVTVYMAQNQNRLRFSLAHELAHVILHKDILARLPFRSMAEWKRVYATIPEADYAWIEWQGYALAGLLLVPTRQLAAEFPLAVQAVRSQSGNAPPDVERHMTEMILADTFAVSQEVIQRRLQKDGL